jgi:hypothetical protein
LGHRIMAMHRNRSVRVTAIAQKWLVESRNN